MTKTPLTPTEEADLLSLFAPGGPFHDNVRAEGPDDRSELEWSLKTFGWLPGLQAIRDQHGTTLTGHRRLAAAAAVGARPEILVADIPDDADGARLRLQLALGSNMGAKPFTPEDRARIARYLYGEGWVQARIAEVLKVDQKTVSRGLAHEAQAGSGTVPKPDRPKGGRPPGPGKPRGASPKAARPAPAPTPPPQADARHGAPERLDRPAVAPGPIPEARPDQAPEPPRPPEERDTLIDLERDSIPDIAGKLARYLTEAQRADLWSAMTKSGAAETPASAQSLPAEASLEQADTDQVPEAAKDGDAQILRWDADGKPLPAIPIIAYTVPPGQGRAYARRNGIVIEYVPTDGGRSERLKVPSHTSARIVDERGAVLYEAHTGSGRRQGGQQRRAA
jgi:ParB-like chromosome segregation protein Spo0J